MAEVVVEAEEGGEDEEKNDGIEEAEEEVPKEVDPIIEEGGHVEYVPLPGQPNVNDESCELPVKGTRSNVYEFQSSTEADKLYQVKKKRREM
eukprot:8353582-Pyramimonas_sp.AAC.1